MKRLFVMTGAVLLALTATAKADFVYRSADGSVSRTHCDYHRVYGVSCWTNSGGTGNNARVIDVPQGSTPVQNSNVPFNCPSCADARPYVGGEPEF